MNYKMTVYPAINEVGNINISFLFETAEQMAVAQDTVANMLLFIQDQALMKDYPNAFILEEYVHDKWEYWEEYEEF